MVLFNIKVLCFSLHAVVSDFLFIFIEVHFCSFLQLDLLRVTCCYHHPRRQFITNFFFRKLILQGAQCHHPTYKYPLLLYSSNQLLLATLFVVQSINNDPHLLCFGWKLNRIGYKIHENLKDSLAIEPYVFGYFGIDFIA